MKVEWKIDHRGPILGMVDVVDMFRILGFDIGRTGKKAYRYLVILDVGTYETSIVYVEADPKWNIRAGSQKEGALEN